jgi:hypothetical protein
MQALEITQWKQNTLLANMEMSDQTMVIDRYTFALQIIFLHKQTHTYARGEHSMNEKSVPDYIKIGKETQKFITDTRVQRYRQGTKGVEQTA